MRLTDKHIAEYQRIYLQTFGVHISKEEALIQGMALVRLMQVLAQPAKHAERDHEDKVPGTRHPRLA